MTPPCKIRFMVPTDRPRIADTWVHSHRASALGRSMRAADYTRRMDRAIRAILERTGVGCIFVAHPPDDEDAIMGWACVERVPPATTILHYVWVSGIWRRCGVGRRLLHAIAREDFRRVAVSHLTDRGARIVAASSATRQLVGCEGAPYVRFNDLLALAPDAEVAT